MFLKNFVLVGGVGLRSWLGCPLAAKVGWYLEINATRLRVSASQLDRLRAHRPKGRQCIDREFPQGHRLARGWNLLLPTDLAEQRWREVG